MNRLVRSALVSFFVQNRLTPQTVAEAEMAKVYVHAVKDARLAGLGLTAFISSIVAMVMGLTLLVLGVTYKVADSPEVAISTTAIVMGGIFFLVPLIAFAIVFSQRFMVRATKIDQMVERVVTDAKKAQAG